MSVAGAPIEIGIIGGGMMSQVGHLPFYLDDPRCRVRLVAESRPSLMRVLAERLGPERVVADHEAVLADPAITAVVLIAPRPCAGPLTLAALEAGKHVMTEKPMAHSVARAEQLVAAARARGLIYAVGFMKRYDPGIEAALAAFRELTESRRLGNLRAARFYNFTRDYAMAPPPHKRPDESRAARLATWPEAPDWLAPRFAAAYAWFLNAASHDVNLIRLFFPDGTRARGLLCPNPDAILASLIWREAPIALQVARSGPGRWREGAEFLFERGVLSLAIPSPMDTAGVTEVWLEEAEPKPARRRLATGAGWSFAHQARGFVDALAGGPPPRTTGEEALADMRLIESLWRKAERGDTELLP